jgi:uncharacterized protein
MKATENRGTPERRIIQAAELRIERRGDGADAADYLIGYASVFDEWTTLIESERWTWKETVRRGAFTAALAERQDVRSLFNHDPNFVLGRTAAGTLRLQETEKGLLQETRLSGSQTVRDLVITPIGRGDISGQSFAFLPRNDGSQTTIERKDRTIIVRRSGERITEWEENGKLYTERELLSVDLFDVTVATYPAYRGTSVAMRAGIVDPAELEAAALARHREQLRSQPGEKAWSIQAEMRLRLAEAGA